ncbi:hypothetical protein J4407_01265 [Candidatus Pacearchaeota archaeon]|nr:hypothetical protein [Candidatus Pacearchaeota archaeon]
MKLNLKDYAVNIITHKFLTSVTGKISDRAKRKFEKYGQEAAERLKVKEALKDSNLILRLGWSDEAVSYVRKITLALEEFKQVNPKAYTQFERIRGKHKDVRRAYIEFGGEVPDSYYIKVIKDIIPGINDKDAVVFYNRLKSADKILTKKGRGIQRLLLPE